MSKAYDRLEQEDSPTTSGQTSLLNIITFGWLSPLLKTANERPLDPEDLPNAINQIPTEEITKRYLELWELQLKTQKPQLWKVMVRAVEWRHILSILTIFFLFRCCEILQPVFLNFLLKELLVIEERHQETSAGYGNGTSSVGKTSMFMYFSSPKIGLYLLGLSVASIVRPIATTQYLYVAKLLSTQVLSGLTGLVYNKILSSKRHHLDSITTGHMVNLISKDLEPLGYLFTYASQLFLAPFEALVVLVLLCELVGAESTVSIGYLFLFMACKLAIGKVLKQIRRQMTRRTDKRLKLVSNVVSGIRVIKMNVWETLMDRLIGDARREELKTIFQSNVLRAVFYTFQASFINTASFLAITALLYSGHVITPRNVFTALTFMSIFPNVMRWFGYSVDYGANGLVTIERIQKFLLHDNDGKLDFFSYNNDVLDSDQQNDNFGETDSFFESLKQKKNQPEIFLYKVTCSLPKNVNNSERKNIFRGLNLQVTGSTLLAVIGKIGSGKSSLLNLVLGELPVTQGEVHVKGSLAYASQTAWLFSGTVRDNILFGNYFDKKRYDDVIRACALDTDLEMFSDGDRTYIGERGVRLSGGQRARVNLARAVYHNADVYLLDDPLSAVDAKVGRHVFNEVIKGMLSNRLRVLVTHHLHYLKYVDRIVVMDTGAISKQGTYDEIHMHLSDGRLEEIMTSVQNGGKSLAEVDETDISEEETKPCFNGKMNDDAKEKEDKEAGHISYKTYWRYARSGSSVCGILLMVFLILFNQCSTNGAYFWLSHWTKMPANEQLHLTNLYIYTGIALCSMSSYFMVSSGIVYICRCASRNIHKRMVHAILRCPVRFFDTNPAGRILNRFSSDTSTMDYNLVEFLVRFIIMSTTCFFDLAIISFTNPIMLLVSLPMIYFIVSKTRYFLKASREVQRLMAISGSPLYGHFFETIEGADVIRAFRANEAQTDIMGRYRDNTNRNLLLVSGCNEWLLFRANLYLALLVIFVAIISLLTSPNSTAVGFAIFYSIKLSSMWNVVVTGGKAETSMTSVERVLHYTKLETDPGYEIQAKPPPDWPMNGSISFNDVTLTYFRGGPQALNGINLVIKSGEKVGIVGRTGAGKSSMIAALFRLPQVHSGSIMINDVIIENLNVRDTRSAIGCIPQDPFLFIGSLRFNLDPSGEHDIAELWAVLDKVELKRVIGLIPEGLDYYVNEGGTNFSVGQRQLLCLARALLQQKKIVVLDEATAHVDFTTDKLIQDTIRNKLKEQTVLAIAHRLDTVLDYDRVVVIDSGKVVETGHPRTLLRQVDSVFASMYQTSISSRSEEF